MNELTRRRMLQGTGALAAGLALSSCRDNAEQQSQPNPTHPTQGGSQPAAKRPNIVLVLADDIGFSDLGSFGAEIATPNLDRLAAKGWRMTNVHNNPRCCPSRASLLTGLYPTQAGVGCMTSNQGTPAYQGYLNDQCVTLGQTLGQAGYQTAISGKWHVAPPKRLDVWPANRGFDRSFCEYGAGTHFDTRRYIDGKVYGDSTDPNFYLTFAVTDYAVSYIHEFAKHPDPFFVYVAYHAPHFPLQAPEPAIAQYHGTYDMGWNALRQQRYQRAKDVGVIDPAWRLSAPAWEATPWLDTGHHAWESRRMEVYAAQITLMDEGIGKIVATLEQEGVADNTVILFLGDNGACAEDPGFKKHRGEITRDGLPMQPGNDPSIMPGPSNTFQSYGVDWANASNTPFRKFKRWTEEGGISTPCVAYWPGTLAPGKTDHSLIHIIDFMPTFMELAGHSYPTTYGGYEVLPVQGESFAPMLAGLAAPSSFKRRNHLFWEHLGHRAARDDEWKVVSNHPTGPFQLFNMYDDRSETLDLSSQYPSKARELASEWQAWKVRTGVRTWNRRTKYRPT